MIRNTAMIICYVCLSTAAASTKAQVAAPNSNVGFIAANVPASASAQNIQIQRDAEENCLRAGRWIGRVTGGAFGAMSIYWSIAGESASHGSIGRSLLTG
ncbi:hypothetical protein ACFLZR_02055, partial [Candidatus Neomarinimicrobiota bacterium]